MTSRQAFLTAAIILSVLLVSSCDKKVNPIDPGGNPAGTVTSTATQSNTIVITATITASASEVEAVTVTATVTVTETEYVIATASETVTATVTATATATATATVTATVTASATATMVDCSASVTFLDSNLETVMRQQLNLPSNEPITRCDLQLLTGLFEANFYDISNLSGLEYCVNIDSLSLTSNQITDISPLSGLSDLQQINLDDNQITDISALSGLVSLNSLVLNSNQITDIEALIINAQAGGLDSGDTVYLQGNPLSSQALNDIDTLRNIYGVTVYY